MVAGVTSNEEVPQRKTKNYFSSARYSSRCFSHKFISDN